MLKALLARIWPPVPYRVTYRFARRTIDFLGTEWVVDNCTKDAQLAAAAEGWQVEGWAVDVVLLDLYKVEQGQPDDLLQVSMKLIPPT